MKKAKIYIPTKSAMQSGRGKQSKWILEYEVKNSKTNPLMGWETSDDTYSEIRLQFDNKEKAIQYAKKNKIDFKLILPKTRKFVIKSYSDNFIKN